MSKNKKLENLSPVYKYHDRLTFIDSLLLIGNIIVTAGIIGLLIAIGIGIDDSNLKYFISLIVVFSVFVTFWFVRKGKSSYEIYEDRIDFFSIYIPHEKDVIKLDEIYQVRYEDEFKQVIFLYVKNGYKSKAKRIDKNRFTIVLRKDKFIDDLIMVLSFFKEKNKEIYILTKRKEINIALDIENWKEPDFVNHKLIDMFLNIFR